MKREEFFEALKTFDWYYEMSDSGAVWASGDRALRALKAESTQDPTKQRMYAEFCGYYNGSRPTKPTREEFGL